jgi:hypothetical protein
MTATQHDAADHRYASHLGIDRSDNLIFDQITAANTRSVEQKKSLLWRVAELLGESPACRGGRARQPGRGCERESALGNGLAQHA